MKERIEEWKRGFNNCELCEWKCGVNRLEGESGVCGVGMPEIAYCNLAQVLQSYSVTMLGCSFKCIYCNAYRLSQYPGSGWFYRGYIDPVELAAEAIRRIKSPEGKAMHVDKISFTGGEPTIHFPYIAKVVEEARKRIPELGVGFATNGFASQETLQQIIDLCSYVTFEIKAFSDNTHRAITGAPVEPVLRNAEYLIRNGRDKIRAFRTIVIPGINDTEIEEIAQFLASIDTSVPLRIIPFRPNYILYYHPGPTKKMMDEIGQAVSKTGLENVWWSGYYPMEASKHAVETTREFNGVKQEGARLAFAYSKLAGCVKADRNCGKCPMKLNCPAGLKEPWLLDLD
ncbi:MAG: radical SAM protein [Methanophagales archaeon]|nr:radical SAM protein [Methanophagales archaeon]